MAHQRTIRLPGIKTWWGGAVYVTPEKYQELIADLTAEREVSAETTLEAVFALRREFQDLADTYGDYENSYAEGQHDAWNMAEVKLANVLLGHRVPGP